MQIIPLSEGSFTIDKTKIFLPFDVEDDQLQSRPTGSLLVEVQPFVVKTAQRYFTAGCWVGLLQKGRTTTASKP